MTTEAGTSREGKTEVLGLSLRIWEAGSGDPLVLVHHDIGNREWLPIHEQLAGRHQVRVPELPGYGPSDRPAWARHPRDLAIILNLLLDKLNVGPATLLGLG